VANTSAYWAHSEDAKKMKCREYDLRTVSEAQCCWPPH